MTLVINGKEYNLTSSVLTMDTGLNEQRLHICCAGADMSEWGIDWILGDPFIRQWCNTHDVQNLQLGLAPALAVLQRSA